MRKFYLLFAAMFAYSVVATAGIKNLFKQDFETVSTPADAGWTSPNLAGGMKIVSTEEGGWFEFDLGGNNNRNAVMNWNPAEGTIFDGQDVKKYTVKFQWGLVAHPKSNGTAKNTQFSSEIAVLSPHNYVPSETEAAAGVKATNSINNGQYAMADSLRLFSITQLKGAWQAADATKEPPVEQTPYWEDENDLSNFANVFFIDGDTENRVELDEDKWYDITLTVDVEARTTKYEIATLDGEVLKEGEGKIAANCDPYAKGINVLLGRYYSIADIDEVKVQVETEGDYANVPSIALTGVNMSERSYLIFFEEGEILHVKGTDGKEDTATESPYEYKTETSGKLDAWTESGSALSEHAILDVDANPITLPEAVVDITKVNAGYVKTYKMTVDNSKVPTQPTITLTYEYNGKASEGEVPSGSILDVTEKGVLKVTTHAFGFVESTIEVANDTEFAVDASVDFQHMEEAKLTELGFAEIDPLQSSTMSGETNWTGRGRLWFGIENGETADDGSAKYDKYVVYGAEGASEVVEPIRRFTIAPAALTKEAAYKMFAPVYTWYTGQDDPAVADGTDVGGMKMNYGIGLINDGIKGGQEPGKEKINYANAPMGVDGLTDNDYYIAYVISDYGTSSKHPVYAQGTKPADGKALYKAENLGDGTNVQVKRGTETLSLYRIDTAIARIDVFKAQGQSGIETLPYNQIVSDHNAPIYNLNGVQMNPNTLKKGVYVKQGKKFVIK